jgi:hypothetical protein
LATWLSGPRALARQGESKVALYLMGKIKVLPGRVDPFGITREHLEQLTEAYSKWPAPEPIRSTLDGIHSMTNAVTARAYPIGIPSHVRNALTAATNNARDAVGLRDDLDQLQAMTGRVRRELSKIQPSLAGRTPARDGATQT